MFRIKDECVYLQLGGEVFLFGVNDKLCESVKSSVLLKGKSAVHIFITEYQSSAIKALANLLSYLYYSVFQENGDKINVYCPDALLPSDLRLHQVSDQWYNFLINLWDEVPVNGLEEPVEYMFYQDRQSCVDGGEESGSCSYYSIELVSTKLFYLYYCAGDIQSVLERGVQYDSMCVMIQNRQQYDWLLDSTGNNTSLRKKMTLISHTGEVQESEICRNGFLTAIEEE